MSSPFYLLENLALTRKVMKNQYSKRAKQIARRVSPYILGKDKIIDIGTGTGYVARSIIEKKKNIITCVDVRLNPLCKTLPVLIYDGKRLPFKDNTFDTALLIAVLHHCRQPLKVLDEAVRVSSKKVIIMEDLFESSLEKWLTLIEDSIVNWEFRGHPHSNKTEKAWLEVFDKKGLQVINFEKFQLICAGFPFRLGIFVLEKQKSNKL
jgi:ubiquinone/menaquinone biosynthesis C-methylase UbiE